MHKSRRHTLGLTATALIALSVGAFTSVLCHGGLGSTNNKDVALVSGLIFMAGLIFAMISLLASPGKPGKQVKSLKYTNSVSLLNDNAKLKEQTSQMPGFSSHK